ncbi:MAG: potassium-transporting ATPase subunit KdpA [Verrucomicrobia bacterium]|nr:MAG: potassium-transporting ATPase subunit KdpA [Verrucomicrobiota bacterium]
MTYSGWIQFILFIGVLLAITKPLGLFLCRVLDAKGKTFLDPVIGPVERLTYRVCGIDPQQEQDWKQYAVAMLLFSFVSMLFTYAILRLQGMLPLNPQNLGALSEHLAFNTAASFATNTNWQSYGGESTMSYFSQMVGLTFQNFVSAAVGITIAAALVRGMARHTCKTIGNFWVDLIRITYYLLCPICLVFAAILISQGVIQNFKPYDSAKLVEPFTAQVAKVDEKGQPVHDASGNPVLINQKVESQTIVNGPMASQVAIKMFGTNGGGYTNVNGAHPFENPTPISNFLQMLSVLAIPSALTYYFGRTVKNLKHGWTVWAVMFVLFLASLSICWYFEAAGNPNFTALGVDPGSGNMEGKEVRFGIFNSVLFNVISTITSCGATNAALDSFTPLGGAIPLFNIQLSEVVFGGVGTGLTGMLVYIVIAIFVAGLMIGRTPEYLGKKIGAYDVKMASFVIFIFAFVVLGFTAWACLHPMGLPDATGKPTDGTNNGGPHAFTEILYAYSSAAGNNGSGFAGISANAPWYDTTLGLAMLFGRYAMIIPMLALAGSFAKKKLMPTSPGSFPLSGLLFGSLLIGTIILVGALTFVPALVLGPVVEHFLMLSGKLF